MIRPILERLGRMLTGFLKPFMVLVYQAVVQFLKWWRDADWGSKLLSLPVLVLALLFLGIYVFLFGCRV